MNMDNTPNKSISMNYLEQIRLFWRKDLEFRFSNSEIAFYFYLLHISNSLKWQKVFGIPNKEIATKFNWGRCTLSKVQNKLKEAQLIDYKKGLGRGNTYQYELIAVEKKKAAEAHTYTFHLPFQSQAFSNQWQQLISMPKWKTKPIVVLQANLDQLGQYDEKFAIELIKQTILGNWQGLIYKDTNSYYKKWKLENSYNKDIKNDSDTRKSEIIRRAELAASECNT